MHSFKHISELTNNNFINKKNPALLSVGQNLVMLIIIGWFTNTENDGLGFTK